MNRFTVLRTLACTLLVALTVAADAAEKTKIVIVAGRPSHGWGAHEHRAGSILLANRLNKSGLNVKAEVVTDGWPRDDNSIFEDAATVVIYADGWSMHPVKRQMDFFDGLAKKGVGFVTIHWATEVQRGPLSEKFLEWQGGFCDVDWSVNPHWDAAFKELPEHPITNGVKPFTINDEWYYHMRFVDGLKGVTPILTALPDETTLVRPDGPRSGNPDVRRAVANKEPQHVAWAYERAGGGRGFGFTGGHVHDNWAHDDFRKLVLNAICWTAKVEVPEKGIQSMTPTREELDANQDERKPRARN
ncbi:MAG: ThuA domain-containing protein [Candidatus Hydrogenedentota bacterium]